MKKQLKNVFVTAMLAVGLLFSSCAKEDPAIPLNVNMDQTATIHGKILVNKNEAATTQTWSAPDDFNVIATVPYSSLNSSAIGDYVIPSENISYNKSAGEFTIKAPVGIEGSNVTVKFSDFKGSVRANKGGKELIYSVIWKGKSANTGKIYPNETFYLPTWKLNGSAHYTIEASVNEDI